MGGLLILRSTRGQGIDSSRKNNVLPAVIFFVLSVVITIGLVFAFAKMFVAYVIQNKIAEEYAKTLEWGEFIDIQYNYSNNYKTVISDVLEGSKPPKALYIFDGNNNKLAGYGGETYDAERFADDFENGRLDSYILYQDAYEHNASVTSSGELDIGLLGLVRRALFSNDQNAGNSEDYEWINEKILSVSYWKTIQLSKGDRALVKNSITILRSDVIVFIVVGFMALVLIFVPLIFMFVNLVGNIKSQHQMSQLVFTDPVTGGKNKLYFEHQALRILKRIMHNNDKYAVIDLTMRKYRNYCACYGTAEGEELLKKIDAILNMHVNPKWEIAAHSAYGTYALLLRVHNNTSIQLEERIREILAALRASEPGRRLSFSAGVNVIDPAYTESDKKIKKKDIDILQCYENASIARYTLRGEEDGGIAFFDQELIDKQRWEHTVEIKMNEALKNEEFAVFYQPKHHPITQKLNGAEALIRWISPDEGFIPPSEFIPIFERNGFITRIDDYMISHVAKQQSEWIAQGKKVVPISVNVSRAHFSQPDLAEHICKLVDAYKTPHDVVEIELTESAFFDDKDALLRTVNKLKEYGFEISMDDFGAGYSSLNSLKDLPLDVLKLDAEFFRGEEYDGRGKIIVAEAILLAKKLNMRVVAEGIEKKEQVDYLGQLGCDMIQGFYFAKPMPVEEFEKRAFAE